MKKTVCLLLVFIALLSLFGCAKEEEEPRGVGAMGSEVWETMPALTYGEMAYEKLQVLDWNSGRCEATSFNSMAETENGYYLTPMDLLLYADKISLGTWLPVCNSANCEHSADNFTADSVCDAYVAYQEFVIRGDRIFYQIESDFNSGMYKGGAEMVLASMAADGSDKKVEYAFDAYVPTTVSSYMSFLSSQHYFYNVVEQNSDGTQTVHSYRLTERGSEEVATVDNYTGMCLLRSPRTVAIYGDQLVHNGAVTDSMTLYFRYTEDEYEEIDIGDFPKYSYLSGDTLRFFRTNDGYYDRNIKTGEEVKLADAQLENSVAAVVLPNCILESTLLGAASQEYRVEGMTHEMKLFDGQSWRDITIPDEWKNAGEKARVTVKCVTSDSIFLIFEDLAVSNRTGYYYRIDLNADQLTAEYLMEYTV